MSNLAATWNNRRLEILSVLFIVSGLCSLLYQTIWLRLAFANFGVITPVVSVVVSVFMMGIALGSWLAGRYVEPIKARFKVSAIFLYGIAELTIGLGAFLVPVLFGLDAKLLLALGESNSGPYLLYSALAMALTILPWATAMGTTFPFALSFLKEFRDADPRSFGFLYLSNVEGAVFGTLCTVICFIEWWGFSTTLAVAACLNFCLGAVSLLWAGGQSQTGAATEPSEAAPSIVTSDAPRTSRFSHRLLGVLLFTTGLVSMAMEIVWIRAFTAVLGQVVYSFAFLLATYLAATLAGSMIYRRQSKSSFDLERALPKALLFTAVTAFLPSLMNNPLWNLPLSPLIALVSIAPFCAGLGYLTPMLVDEVSKGDARVAGRAYAYNVIGCIIGPLVAGYIMLPIFGVAQTLAILCVPLGLLACYVVAGDKKLMAASAATLIALTVACVTIPTWEDSVITDPNRIIRRDYTATTISGTHEGIKQLLVNGCGVTFLVQPTKDMAHMTLATMDKKPESVLVICFGMGTTFRSCLSWDIDTTAVELIPSVPKAMPYYWADAPQLVQKPNAKIVIDDGRRFLNRTTAKYDAIIVDPPPPFEAAASSLLYSKEFYARIKEHLKPTGVFQQWLAHTKDSAISSAVKALQQSFKYVIILPNQGMGWHCLCADHEIELNPSLMVQRMPENARKDLGEFFAGGYGPESLEAHLTKLFGQRVTPESLYRPNMEAALTDDRPLNEYYFLRHAFDKF